MMAMTMKVEPKPVYYSLTFSQLDSLASFLQGVKTEHLGRDIYQWMLEEGLHVWADDYPYNKGYVEEAKEAYNDV